MKKYKLREFKAVQWLGNNLNEVQELLQDDPDSAAWVEEREACGSKFNICFVASNDYIENCCHELELWPYDYVVSWGDHYKRFNHKFFQEMFEEI